MAESTPKKSHSTLLKPLGVFFRRFHLLIFFIVLAASVSVAIVMLNETLTDTTSGDYTSAINAGSIDQATLERIQSLHPSSQPNPAPQAPEGRLNPFAE